MKLARWTPIVMGRGDYADCIIDQDGQYYRAVKVDALLARIRAAVDAERAAEYDARSMNAGSEDYRNHDAAVDALDALLSRGA